MSSKGGKNAAKGKRKRGQVAGGGGGAKGYRAKSAEERELEALVFGDGMDLGTFGLEADDLLAEDAIHASFRSEEMTSSFASDADGEVEGHHRAGRAHRQATSSASLAHASDDDDDDEHEDAGKTHTSTKEKNRKNHKAAANRSAWKDEDDQKLVVDLSSSMRLKKLRERESESVLEGSEFERRLRAQHSKLQQADTAWAQLAEEGEDENTGHSDDAADEAVKRRRREAGGHSDSDEDDDEADLFASTGGLLRSRTLGDGGPLAKGVLNLVRCQDANHFGASDTVVQSTQFHPDGQLLLTGSMDKCLRLFHIDGKENSRLCTVLYKDLPIRSANFTRDGKEVICSGRRSYFYVYNLLTGKSDRVMGIRGRTEKSFEKSFISPDNQFITFFGNDGTAILVSNRTKQCVGTLKMNGSLRSAAYSSDSRYLFTSGGDGEIYQWDMGSRKCIHRFEDEGCLSNTALALSPNGRYLASGARSGVVNIYDVNNLSGQRKPKPLHSVMNLTTSIGQVQFNHDSQMLAVSSAEEANAFKMIHIPSFTAFSNWPTANTPLHRVSTHDFSPHSGYLAIGNQRGKVLLYRLRHFNNA